MLHFNVTLPFYRPTLNINEGNLTVWIPHTIVSSTSVASFILFTSDGQRKAQRHVVRNSSPGNTWCWIAISSAYWGHFVTFIHCSIPRDVGDVWSIYVSDKGNKSDDNLMKMVNFELGNVM